MSDNVTLEQVEQSGESHRAAARRLLRDCLVNSVTLIAPPFFEVIAEQFNLRTVYDASYAALAELRGCEFWTADKIFYDTVKAELMFVKYLPDYP